MITIDQFVWLIHYLLIFGYIFEIGRFFYLRIQYKDLFKQASEVAPHIFEQEMDKWGGPALGFGSAHVIAFGIYSKAVPLFLIILVIGWIYSEVRSDALKPYIKAHNRDNPKTGSKNSQGRIFEIILMTIGGLVGVFVWIATKKASPATPDVVGGVLGVTGLMLGRWIAREYFKTKSTNSKRCTDHTLAAYFQGKSCLICLCLWPLTMASSVEVR